MVMDASLPEAATPGQHAATMAAALLQALPLAAYALDGQGRVVFWNPDCESLTGLAAERVLGTCEHWRAFHANPAPSLADLLREGCLERLGEHWPEASVLDQGPDWARVAGWRLLPLQARRCYLELGVRGVRDATGALVAVIETLHDRTREKTTEQELRLAASVFEHAQEGIVMTDPDTRILDVNTAFSLVTGYSREEMIGRTPALLQSGLQDAAFYREMWQRLNESGRWSGEIWNRRKSGEVYPEILHINAVPGADGGISHFIGMFSDITEQKNSQRRLESLANHDALTGLPNRVLLGDRLHQALANAKRHERLVAICFLDLDDFKLINDRFGHEVGDQFLVEIARRLIRAVRGGDTIARLGGDEFVLLIGDLKHVGELETVLGRLLEEISQPFQVLDLSLDVSGSLGVTLYPFDDADPDTLLRHADQAMYQAKQLGRNRYQLFDREAAARMQHRHRELERIRQALQHGEFILEYQPKVNMRSGEVVGFEALIRWCHPERGRLAPCDFLPLIEQTNLIVDLGDWVLHEALAQLDQWRAQGHALGISVNIAARQFQHIDFVSRLRTILNEHPEVPPECLELEILEHAALSDLGAMRGVMSACQALGVRFALDDFGTGYSSLASLKQLPVETLKIDRTFVRSMLVDKEDLAIIEGVIGLARIFGRQVIAEGVESVEHAVLLLRIGCDQAQGYAISPPLPAKAVSQWLADFRPDPKWLFGASSLMEHLDVPLLLAQYDHVKWVRQLVDVPDEGNRTLPPAEEVDAECGCRFGQWLRGEGRERYGQLPEHAEIEQLHRRMHRLAQEIGRLRANEQWEAARLLCMDLIGMKRQILARLDSIQHSRLPQSSSSQGVSSG